MSRLRSTRTPRGVAILAACVLLAGVCDAPAGAEEGSSLMRTSHDAHSGDPHVMPHSGGAFMPPEPPCYPLPSHQYGAWYRPRAAGLDVEQRCRPDAFRPRGYGNLFARRDTTERMDYHPYVLYDAHSQYGPSYYHRHQWQYRDHHSRSDCQKQTRPFGGLHDRLLGR